MTTTATTTSQQVHISQINHIFSSNSDPSSQNEGTPVARGPVATHLKFYTPPSDGTAPFNYVGTPPEGQPQHNYGDVDIAVQISDIRGQEFKYTLDNNAFETISDIQSEEKDFNDDTHIKEVYYPEVEQLILDNVPGAKRVLLFDHTIRRANPNAPRAPVTRVHIDRTVASAEARVRHHLPEEAETLLQGRYRIINVWRPLNGPVVSFPLGFADGATVADEDLVGVEHRYPDRTGETAGVKYNPKQNWYYWSGMQNDERLLLKCSDSDEAVGPHGRVPHAAFVDPRTPADASGRESIEVRALVFG
ncbi:MAG: hypothetical protein M1836_005873 [Candelina mexicana]|nr:MAG: hypothetical protein M1836_005873 [Candelina mexicana]